MQKQIIIKILIEILGSPKEHVEKTLDLVIDKLKKDFKVLKDVKYKTEEVKGLWSNFADIEVEINTFDDIISLCFDYMPSSIEILEPQELNVKCNELMDLFNDLLARLHRYDMLVKNYKAENTLLKKKLKD